MDNQFDLGLSAFILVTGFDRGGVEFVHDARIFLFFDISSLTRYRTFWGRENRHSTPEWITDSQMNAVLRTETGQTMPWDVLAGTNATVLCKTEWVSGYHARNLGTRLSEEDVRPLLGT